MTPNFVAFRNLNNINDAKQLEALLDESGISSIIKDVSSSLDGNFSGSSREYELQVLQEDFEKASGILEAKALELLNDVPADYYLYEFTDEELMEVLAHRDEWSEFDYLLSRKLLTERGSQVDDIMLTKMRDKRISELSRPETGQRPWIIAGYIMALLGGFFGVITGYVLWTSKKTLPNGSSVYTYSESDRKHGKIILIIGMVVLSLMLLLKIVSKALEE